MPLELKLTLTDEDIERIADAIAERMGKATGNHLSVAEFAKAINKDQSHVRRLIYAGVITKSPLPGRTQIPASELERYRKG
jgi:hypothetical protein